MRCPNCSFEVQGTPRFCPNCDDTLPAPEAWEVEVDARPWVRIGDIFGLSAGVILVVSRWQGALGVSVGVLLIALALVSLIVSRGGTRWERLPAIQKIIVGLGAGAIVGFALLSLILAVAPALVPMLGRFQGGPSGNFSRRRSRRRDTSDYEQAKRCPICGKPILLDQSMCSACAAMKLS